MEEGEEECGFMKWVEDNTGDAALQLCVWMDGWMSSREGKNGKRGRGAEVWSAT